MLQYVIWSAALVIVVTIFLVIFRKPVAGLIDRTSRAGYGDKSIEFLLPTNTAEQQKTIPTTPEARAPAPTVPAQAVAPSANEIYAGIEKEILDALNAAKFPPDLERAWLIRSVATTRIWRAHEITYRLILGSQLGLLLAANSLTPPDMTAAQALYDNAKAAFPTIFQNFSFDNWLNWPINSDPLKIDQSNPARSVIRITPIGQDFLHYLVANSLTANKAG